MAELTKKPTVFTIKQFGSGRVSEYVALSDYFALADELDAADKAADEIALDAAEWMQRTEAAENRVAELEASLRQIAAHPHSALVRSLARLTLRLGSDEEKA